MHTQKNNEIEYVCVRRETVIHVPYGEESAKREQENRNIPLYCYETSDIE